MSFGMAGKGKAPSADYDAGFAAAMAEMGMDTDFDTGYKAGLAKAQAKAAKGAGKAAAGGFGKAAAPTGKAAAPWGGKAAVGKGAMDGGKGKGKGGKGRDRIQAGEAPYVGTCKSYNVEKSSGFIVSEHLHAEGYQGDVYAFKSVLEQAKAGPGDRVAFFVHWSAKGLAQASNPAIRIACAEESGLFALKGTYKSGGEGKTHGFMTCQETFDYFGRDVYVRAELATDLIEGQAYAFNCFLNRERKPNLEQAEICDEDWEPLPGSLDETAEVHVEVKGGGKAQGGWEAAAASASSWDAAAWSPKGKGKGKAKGATGKGSKAGGGGAGAPAPTGQCYSGFVKSFNENNNYGFIDCADVKAEYGCDVFVHGKELQNSQAVVGTTVAFELGLNAKGQPQALNLNAMDDQAGGAPAAKKGGKAGKAGKGASSPY